MNIFVAKINFKSNSTQLRQLFEKYGVVDSAKIITDKETNKSKGFGFVEMPNDNEARKAINALDGIEFDGRTIVVQESKK